MKVVGVLAGILILLFASPSQGKPNYQEQIQSEIDGLLIKGDYSYKIISMSETVDNVLVAALTPPYREFPNIILFKVDPKDGSLKRVYEALCLGIQDAPSGLLDLHTTGNAIDFFVDEGKLPSIGDKTTKTAMEIFEKGGGTIVLYGRFLHGHFGQQTRQRYLLDKTQYKRFALALLGERYNKYPDKECMMYDTPNLREVKFSKKDGKYHLAVKTSNNQKWTVTFTGVDADNRYLTDKAISVEKITGR
jgi:hypothetical protein